MAVRRIRIALLAALSALVLPAAAHAVPLPLVSDVTTPATGSRMVYDATAGVAPTMATFSGTSNRISGIIDLNCYTRAADDSTFVKQEVAPDVATDGTGDWSVNVDVADKSLFQSCLVRAVADGVDDTTDLSGVSGPTVYFTKYELSRVASGVNAGKIKDWNVADGGTGANVRIGAPFTGIKHGALASGSNLRDSREALTYESELYGDSNYDITGYGGVSVDGRNAYTPDGATYDGNDFGATSGENMPGLQPISVTITPSITGAVHVDETMPLVRCNAGFELEAPGSACTAFVGTGVSLHRVWDIDATGRQTHMKDSWNSTDGAAHAVVGQYWSFPGDAAGTYEFPWSNAGAPTAWSASTAIAVPPTAPWSFYTHSMAGSADGDVQFPQAVRVVKSPPSKVAFAPSQTGYLTSAVPFSVPAGGSATDERSVAISASHAELVAFANTETDRMAGPSVAITAPSAGAALAVTPVVVSGTASDNAGIASLTVNGVATPVTGGTFSSAITPLTGSNTVTVIAKDAAGNTATATRSFTYATPATPLQTTFIGTAKNDKLVGNSSANILNGLAGNDTIDCGAGGKDQANGGDGNDKMSCVEPLATARANADIVNCGPGTKDVAIVDPFDKVIGCEIVTRVWIGSIKADKVKGTKANDRFDLKAGNDTATCGGGVDTVLAGAGNDTINCVDRGKTAKKNKDVVNCGAGTKDVAVVDKWDKVVGCEQVKRV